MNEMSGKWADGKTACKKWPFSFTALAKSDHQIDDGVGEDNHSIIFK